MRAQVDLLAKRSAAADVAQASVARELGWGWSSGRRRPTATVSGGAGGPMAARRQAARAHPSGKHSRKKKTASPFWGDWYGAVQHGALSSTGGEVPPSPLPPPPKPLDLADRTSSYQVIPIDFHHTHVHVSLRRR